MMQFNLRLVWFFLILVNSGFVRNGLGSALKNCSLQVDEQGKLVVTNCHVFYKKLVLSQFSQLYPRNEGINSVGRFKSSAVKTCKELKNTKPRKASGIYWIDPDGGSQGNAFQAYCDMETAGGGWTLVYSYTFKNYKSYRSGSNAVTPRPNWTVRGANVPISTRTPLSETDYNAMNFKLWQKLGSEILIKSNINHWVSCKPGSGSLVLWKSGSVQCRMVKSIVNRCTTTVPSNIKFYSPGPSFDVTSHYYYFDGSTSGSSPTHDPCGANGPRHLHNVHNPHGNVYIR